MYVHIIEYSIKRLRYTGHIFLEYLAVQKRSAPRDRKVLKKKTSAIAEGFPKVKNSK